MCQAGKELLCSGYTLYSSSTVLVLTVGALHAWPLLWGLALRGLPPGHTPAAHRLPLRCAEVALSCCAVACAGPRRHQASLPLPLGAGWDACIAGHLPATWHLAHRLQTLSVPHPLLTPHPLCPTGNGVFGFTLDPLIGEFVLSHPNIRIPEKGEALAGCAEGGLTWKHPLAGREGGMSSFPGATGLASAGAWRWGPGFDKPGACLRATIQSTHHAGSLLLWRPSALPPLQARSTPSTRATTA